MAGYGQFKGQKKPKTPDCNHLQQTRLRFQPVLRGQEWAGNACYHMNLTSIHGVMTDALS
jgi:hypothetical protein